MKKNRKPNLFFLRKEYADVEGIFISPEGEKYVGEWCKGKRHGKGVISSPYGLCIEGTFLNDQLKNF